MDNVLPARAAGASVTFEPAARTAWHSHPLGQTLVVTAGCGRVQRWGGPVEDRLDENIGAVAVELTPDDLREIDKAASKITLEGAR